VRTVIAAATTQRTQNDQRVLVRRRGRRRTNMADGKSHPLRLRSGLDVTSSDQPLVHGSSSFYLFIYFIYVIKTKGQNRRRQLWGMGYVPPRLCKLMLLRLHSINSQNLSLKYNKFAHFDSAADKLSDSILQSGRDRVLILY